jgi:anti-sigma factor RsiW
MTRRLSTAHCDVDAAHWSRYLDGEFASAKCRQCEAHLAECPECRANLSDLRRTVAALRRASRQPLSRAMQAAVRRRARAITKRTH